MNSGILVSDILDYFPVFAIICKMKPPSNQVDNYHERDMKKFDLENFLEQLDNQLSLVRNSFCTKSVNKQFDHIVLILSEVASLRKATRKEKRLKLKPWITRGILKSIGFKNKLFQLSHKVNNQANLMKYKAYRNTSNRTIKTAKINYYQNFFTRNKNNAKKIWEAINDLTNRKTKTPAPNKLQKGNGDIITDSGETAEEFNNFFVNIGNSMSKSIPPVNRGFTQRTNHAGLANFIFFEPSTPYEVNDIIIA